MRLLARALAAMASTRAPPSPLRENSAVAAVRIACRVASASLALRARTFAPPVPFESRDQSNQPVTQGKGPCKCQSMMWSDQIRLREASRLSYQFISDQPVLEGQPLSANLRLLFAA